MNDLSERFIKLETAAKKDSDTTYKEIICLKNNIHTLSKEFHVLRGEMHTISELFNMFNTLDKKIEIDRQKRVIEHKEIILLLANKMDNDKPIKWIINMKKSLQWIIWFFMLVGTLGMNNWLNIIMSNHF